MGFSNPFYYLKYLLRRLPKKILVFICIFLIICLCHLKGYCTDVSVDNLPNYDVVEGYRKQMDSNWYRFLYDNIKYAKNHNNTFNNNLVTLFNAITTTATNYRFGLYDANYYTLYFKNSSGIRYQYQDTRLCLGVSLASNVLDTGSIIIPTALNGGSGELYTTVYQPATCLFYQTNESNYIFSSQSTIEIIDVFDNYIPSSLFDIVYSIGQNNFDFTNTDDILNDISEKLDETNQQLEDLNNFFNDNTVPTVTPSDLPSDTMTDITSSGFDGIFTKIYNAFTVQGFETINITIPYLNYTFSISSDFTRLAIRHFTANIGTYSFESFFYLLWYFAISRYIVLDIYKYINDIKNGNISRTDTNIKADML